MEGMAIKMNEDWKEKLIYVITGETVYADEEIERNLNAAIDSLTERERNILRMRYEQGMTLEEVGKEYGVTRERIRQVEAKAIRRLQSPSRKKFILSGLKCDDIDYEISTLEGIKKRRQEFAEKVQKRNELKKELDEVDKLIREFMEDKRKSEFECKTIEELNLSNRSHNCLVRAGYYNWADCMNITMNKLIRMRNMGRKSAREVYEALVREGIIPDSQEERAKLYEGN